MAIISPLTKKNHDLPAMLPVKPQEDVREKITKLVEACTILKTPTQEEVDELQIEAELLEKEIDKGFSKRGLVQAFKTFLARAKLNRVKKDIQGLYLEAKKIEERARFEKIIWQIKRKGFISSLEDKEIQESATSLELLSCKEAFTFRLISADEGLLEFLLISSSDLKKMSICLRSHLGKISVFDDDQVLSVHETADDLVARYAKEAICLSQLQEVALLLTSHGVSSGKLYDLRGPEIEARLVRFIEKCPFGGYFIHPGLPGTVVLARLIPQTTTVQRTIVNLLTTPGSYESPDKIRTAIEFKQMLKGLGQPVKII